jgi:ubiquinol-cytochrome c reductase iron-sulfur subunit
MRPAPSSASAALRTFTRHTLPTPQTSNGAARLAATSAVAPQTQRRSQSGAASASTFNSPFRDNKVDTNQIPSFKAYRAKSAEVSNRTFQYFMVGSMGLLTAAGAKATVQGTTDFHNKKHVQS